MPKQTIDKTDVEPEAPVVAEAEEWVTVRALENLVGAGQFVAKGETYRQPRAAAQRMAQAGWVEIVA